MTKLTVTLLTLVACGGHTAGTAPDAFQPPADSPPVPGPNAVTVTVYGTPTYIAYRDGSGPWSAPAPDASGNYTLQVTSDYQVVYVCADTGTFTTQLYDTTFADLNELTIFCDTSGSGPGTVNVTGKMLQAGTVEMAAADSSTSAPWNFSLDVLPGVHDLVAFDATDLLIRRDVSISSATALPDVDLAHGGGALVPVPFTIQNLAAGEQLTSDLFWETGHDFVSLGGTASAVLTPPAAVVSASDYEYAFIAADGETTSRTVDADLTSGSTSYQLMPILSGILFLQSNGTIGASWHTLPENDEIDLSLSASTSFLTVSATSGWFALHPATQLAFDVAPPGFDPSWKLAPTDVEWKSVAVYAHSGSTYYSTSVVDRSGTARRLSPHDGRTPHRPAIGKSTARRAR